jgi:cytochrome c peroxidase
MRIKVPGRLIVTKSAPYFHDGRVSEMDKAIKVIGEVQLGKELTEQEMNDIKAFMEVLTGTIPGTALKVRPLHESVPR